MMLPLDYNTVPEVGARHTRTLGGNPLKIVHFTRDKPFFKDPRVPLHSLLTCAKAKVCMVEVGQWPPVCLAGWGRKAPGWRLKHSRRLYYLVHPNLVHSCNL